MSGDRTAGVCGRDARSAAEAAEAVRILGKSIADMSSFDRAQLLTRVDAACLRLERQIQERAETLVVPTEEGSQKGWWHDLTGLGENENAGNPVRDGSGEKVQNGGALGSREEGNGILKDGRGEGLGDPGSRTSEEGGERRLVDRGGWSSKDGTGADSREGEAESGGQGILKANLGAQSMKGIVEGAPESLTEAALGADVIREAQKQWNSADASAYGSVEGSSKSADDARSVFESEWEDVPGGRSEVHVGDLWKDTCLRKLCKRRCSERSTRVRRGGRPLLRTFSCERADSLGVETFSILVGGTLDNGGSDVPAHNLFRSAEYATHADVGYPCKDVESSFQQQEAGEIIESAHHDGLGQRQLSVDLDDVGGVAVLQSVTFACLLVEFVARLAPLAGSVEQLSIKAEFTAEGRNAANSSDDRTRETTFVGKGLKIDE
ncbi:hypothetical protein KFL_009320035 [Klebsormidium nitens]|uniref:Uncharacterized protein n=1 Tax=Klebsormidium nitens TaxID=105231 RepID=A0A1Y1IU01_KLENI|nr:hypothetical protein KFL_009320035 [Klebsormidium nitens]|eukprot:GAQ92147.1 hypothetical protein KFL_009320035 [Klebsormidium nitens]